LFLILKHLKNKGIEKISFEKLNSFMNNAQRQQFDYDVFTAIYDQNPKLQNLIKDFDQDSIQLKQSEADDLDRPDEPDADSDNSVGQMAQRATDLGN